MLNFDYSNKTRIVFGRGRDPGWLLGQALRRKGSSPTAGKHQKKRPLRPGSRLLRESGVVGAGRRSAESQAVPDPSGELCRREGIGFILAQAEEASLIPAKAIAMGVPYDGDVVGFLRNRQAYRDCPAGCHHLTLPATEASDGTVVTMRRRS